MKKPNTVPPVPATAAPPRPASPDSFIAGAVGKQSLPWQAPHVRSDLGVAVNTRLPERMKLQIDWLAAQNKTTLRDIVQRAVNDYLRHEFAAMGLDPDA